MVNLIIASVTSDHYSISFLTESLVTDTFLYYIIR